MVNYIAPRRNDVIRLISTTMSELIRFHAKISIYRSKKKEMTVKILKGSQSRSGDVRGRVRWKMGCNKLKLARRAAMGVGFRWEVYL